MTNQPSLLDLPEPAPKRKSGHVPRTSALAYVSIDASSRMRIVSSWLRDFVLHCDHEPTSAELADYANGSLGNMSIDMHLLYVRRGLSDAKAKNVVEHVANGDRTCRVTGRKSVCWRLKTR